MRNEKIRNIEGMFLGESLDLSSDRKGTEGVLSRYRGYKEKDQHFKLTFDQADTNGNLVFFDKDIKVIMKSNDINGVSYNPRYKSDKLKIPYCVKVIDFDEKNKIVNVSHHSARLEKKPIVEQEIAGRLEKKESGIEVRGKVIKIKTKEKKGMVEDIGVWLDLCGVGLMGYVFIGDWSPTYTQSLRDVTEHGSVVNVVIKDKKIFDSGFQYYVCSRKELIEDPWSEKLENKVHEGDIVKIKCISLEENHWFGQIAGVDEIQVFTEYPSSIHAFKIIPGHEYLGKIYHMNVKERSLKARVFQWLPNN